MRGFEFPEFPSKSQSEGVEKWKSGGVEKFGCFASETGKEAFFHKSKSFGGKTLPFNRRA